MIMRTAALAAICGLAACSEPAATADPAPAGPPPVTRADTGGRDLGLRDVVVEWGAPMKVDWGGGLETSPRPAKISLTVLNATDVDISEGTLLCVFETDGERSSAAMSLSETVPAHGSLAVTDFGGIGSENPSDSVVCGVDRQPASEQHGRSGRPEPLPGSVTARSVVKDAPAA